MLPNAELSVAANTPAVIRIGQRDTFPTTEVSVEIKSLLVAHPPSKIAMTP